MGAAEDAARPYGFSGDFPDYLDI